MSHAYTDTGASKVSADHAMAIIREHGFTPEVNSANEISFDVMPKDSPETLFETVPLDDAGRCEVNDIRAALGY